MRQKRNYRSDLLRSLHVTTSDLVGIGSFDEERLRRADQECLTRAGLQRIEVLRRTMTPAQAADTLSREDLDAETPALAVASNPVR